VIVAAPVSTETTVVPDEKGPVETRVCPGLTNSNPRYTPPTSVTLVIVLEAVLKSPLTRM
jgi:hypothetical protein